MNARVLAIVGGVIVVIGGMFALVAPTYAPTREPVPEVEEEEGDAGVMCAQVITPARNPETGEIREFPTPCDVPDGWEVIQNDIPTGSEVDEFGY